MVLNIISHLNLVLILISILLINMVFFFDKLNVYKVLFSLIFGIGFQVLLYFLHIDNFNRLYITISMSLTFTAAWTDIREQKILNINLLMVNLSTVLYLIIDLIEGNSIKYKLAIALILLIITFLLSRFNLLGEGDIPLIVNIAYVFGVYSLLIIAMSQVAVLIYIIITSLISRRVTKKIAYAPSLFIALVLFISCLSPLVSILMWR